MCVSRGIDDDFDDDDYDYGAPVPEYDPSDFDMGGGSSLGLTVEDNNEVLSEVSEKMKENDDFNVRIYANETISRSDLVIRDKQHAI